MINENKFDVDKIKFISKYSNCFYTTHFGLDLLIKYFFKQYNIKIFILVITIEKLWYINLNMSVLMFTFGI